MSAKRQPVFILCPNGHENTPEVTECPECRLPVVACGQGIKSLIQRLAGKAGYFVPHIDGCMIGVGTVGSQIITGLCRSFGAEVSGISFLSIDSMPAPEGSQSTDTLCARFHEYVAGNVAVGGMIYSGLGEQVAHDDEQLESYLQMSGIRTEDAGQALFVTAAVGGGTGGGMAPALARLGKKCNPRASTIAITVAPSQNEADHVHTNALHGISKLVTMGADSNADIVIVLNHDKLRQLRGVGRSGEDLRAEKVVTYLLRVFQLNLQHSGVVRMCRISKGMKIQVFVPCLAIGRSMEIFGSLANVLDSAWAYPLASVDPDKVMASYLILRVPSRLSRDFPEAMVTEEFENWNARHVKGIRSSLVQVLQTDEQSDRIDVCILLGGDDLGTAIEDTIEGHRMFRTHVERSAQWEEYGLSSEKVSEAEQVIGTYDSNMQALRQSSTRK